MRTGTSLAHFEHDERRHLQTGRSAKPLGSFEGVRDEKCSAVQIIYPRQL